MQLQSCASTETLYDSEFVFTSTNPSPSTTGNENSLNYHLSNITDMDIQLNIYE